jgi:hypothetical protein
VSVDPTDDTTALPVRPIVEMKIVNQCRKEINPTMTARLLSLPKQSLFLIVSLATSYPLGQMFSLRDMQDVLNTFYAKRQMKRIDMNTMCLYGESLLLDGLLNTNLAGDRRQQITSLNQCQNRYEVRALLRLCLSSRLNDG